MKLLKNYYVTGWSYMKGINGADRAQRDRINLHGELELKSRFFQESRARYCQEIEELRRI